MALEQILSGASDALSRQLVWVSAYIALSILRLVVSVATRPAEERRKFK